MALYLKYIKNLLKSETKSYTNVVRIIFLVFRVNQNIHLKKPVSIINSKIILF